MRRLKAISSLLLMLGVIAVSVPALALLVRPIIIELTAVGSESTSQIEVVNDRNRAVAVEVRVHRLVLPEKGAPSYDEAADGDFLIFPTIANIPPGGRQVFRVRYVGDPAITQSKLYMFSSSELPVEVDPEAGQAQIQMLYSVGTAVAVRPVNARPDIQVVAVERATNAEGVAGVYVTFQNNGAAHGYVSSATLDLTNGAGWSTRLDASKMGASVGLGMVPANAKRDIFVAVPDVPADGTLSGTVRAGA